MSFPYHIPVLLKEMIEALAPEPNGYYLDGTFGGGGYSRALLLHTSCCVVALDRDPQAIRRGKELEQAFPGRFHLYHGCFSDLGRLQADFPVSHFQGIVFDFGVSSFQLDQPDRGFSFRFDAPLDMRMSQEGLSAQDVVNTESESFLADLIYAYSGEKKSRAIARAIVHHRNQEKITTTAQLARLVEKCVSYSKNDNHPATLTFQALRIYVNNELNELDYALNFSKNALVPGGKLVCVTFHSLEDRLVKTFLRRHSGRIPQQSRHLPQLTQMSNAPCFKDLYPKGICPSTQEVETNPRSRSARLRAGLYLGVDV